MKPPHPPLPQPLPPPQSASASLPVADPPCGAGSKRTPADPPGPYPRKKKINPALDFLKEESGKEQQRHEESEAKTDRFLTLFEKMVDKMPDKQ